MLPNAAKSYYFVGNDPARWRSKVANYGRVCYQAVYAGVDLKFAPEPSTIASANLELLSTPIEVIVGVRQAAGTTQPQLGINV